MTHAQPSFALPNPPRRKWPYILAALVVVAGGVYGGIVIHDHLVSCGSGVTKSGPRDECIGVSGSYVFEESLKPVMEKIHEENKRVEGSGKPWVSIAYIEPISADPKPGQRQYGTREELEGAYIAQRRLNDHQLGAHGDIPQIRLLVANIGLRSEQWKPLTDQLIAMTHNDEHLVAVAGFGQSREGTRRAVGVLRTAGVPMMGTTVTADDLTSAKKVAFFRTAAPNADQASAAVNYLKGRQKERSGYTVMVIRDRNQADIYNTSNYDDFTAAAKRKQLDLVDGELQYVSNTDGVSNAFSSVAQRVCDKHPDVVYFAGRGADLRGFITAMSATDRRCPVTVLTGDDAVNVYYDTPVSDATREQFAKIWNQSKVTVLYTALSHPDLSKTLYPADNNPYTDFRDLYHREFHGSGDGAFQDGKAILGHDSVWTLGVAIRGASGASGSTPVNTGSTLNAVVSGRPVAGVSGPIVFRSDGNPEDKPLALGKLAPDGRYVFQEVIKP